MNAHQLVDMLLETIGPESTDQDLVSWLLKNLPQGNFIWDRLVDDPLVRLGIDRERAVRIVDMAKSHHRGGTGHAPEI